MDVVQDTLNHIYSVRLLLYKISSALLYRSAHHDESKLQSPEKELYEIWRPKLDSMDVDSDEYRDVLVQMGEGLKHHYAANRHHPEHFESGLRGMNLVDVIEMVCDWHAAAGRRGQMVSMKWVGNRFFISEGEALYSIIQNTLELLSESRVSNSE